MQRTPKAAARPRSRSGSAARVGTEPVFEGYWLRLRAAPLKPQAQAAQALADALAPAEPGVAVATALREDAKNQSIAREFLIAAKNPRRAPIANAQAWEGARVLMKSPWVLEAEPLFATPGLEPDSAHTAALLAPHERRAKSVGGDAILPCAKANSIWHLEMINAPQAWLFEPGAGGRRFGEGIVIGHPDTGYTPHEEIWDASPSARRLAPQLGYNFEEGRDSPLDPMNGSHPGHGTATASVIMSALGGPKTPFVTGAAPASRLVPIRVSDSVVHFSFKNATRAIYHAVDRAGAHVISMSLGGPLYSAAFKAAIDYAIGKGVIVMAAAGNVWPLVVYPARFDAVIAVAACNCQSRPWSKSAHGDTVDITAPGESVWRAQAVADGGGIAYAVAPSSGTSYAVATLAGACATWLAFHGRDALIARYGAGRLSAVFKQVLTSQGRRVPQGWDSDNYGAGILDLRALLAAPLPPVGKAAKASPAPADAASAVVARIGGYFPPAQRARVEREVGALLPAPATGRAKSRGDASVAAEFAFHVATNAKLRAQLIDRAKAPAAKSAGKRAAAGSAVVKAMKSPSPSLQARLAGR